MVSALPLASLPVLAMTLLERGRFAVGDGLGEHFVDKGDLRLIGGELPLIDGDFYVAAKYPETVVEVQSRGLAGAGPDPR